MGSYECNFTTIKSVHFVLTLKRVQPASIEERLGRLWLLRQHQCGELKLLCYAQLHTFDEHSSQIPECADIGIDEIRTVQVLDDGWRNTTLLSLAYDETVRVLIHELYAPTLDAEVMIDELNW